MNDRGCDKPAVEMKSIVKVYPDGTLALRGVDLTVCVGEVHALLGENGAGKTTLMRILYGEIRPTRGEVRVFGRQVRFRGPWDALKAGIAMVYQHFSLVPGLTVFENIYLALSAVTDIDRREARQLVERVSGSLGLPLPLDTPIDELPVGVKQRVEIVKALALGAKILVLDEPTSVLSPIETQQLFSIIRRLKSMGKTIIFITHKLREVMEIADHVTVLRRGTVVGSFPVKSVTEAELAKLMVGEVRVTTTYEKRSVGERRVLLALEDVWVRGAHGWAVKGVTLRVHSSEILGIAGVQGNGQKELAEAIAGLREVKRGRIVVNGVDVTGLPTYERYRLGLAYVVDDRSLGLVLDESVTFNAILTRFRDFARTVLRRISWKDARDYAEHVVEEFDIKTPSLGTPVRYLSGGNQQKLMIGRDVARGPQVLVVAEPTHGLDVAATRYVRRLLVELRNSGRAILLISSDLDEIMELSDRVAVIHDGRIVSVKPATDYTAEELGMLMGGAVG